MVQPNPSPNFASPDTEQIQRLHTLILDFRGLLDALPDDMHSAEHSHQFNQLRAEARNQLPGQLMSEVPKAISGDVNTDRSLSIVLILGVIMALLGLGVNAVILDDVIINSLGCCVSSGGMLFVIGAFGVLSMKHYRNRISSIADLRHGCDLMLYQIDYRLQRADLEINS